MKSCKTPEEVEALHATVTAAVAVSDSGVVSGAEGGGAVQVALGLSTLLYRALEDEFRRALRRDTFTKAERDEEK